MSQSYLLNYKNKVMQKVFPPVTVNVNSSRQQLQKQF